jgi:thiamine-phosphate pyrophosphorylase
LWPRVLIVNDEVSLLPLADGVHIGQEDLEVLSQKWGVSKGEVIARLRKGGKIVGLSTHNREEILEANRFDLSYIGLGAYRPTSTKKGATPLPLPLSELIPLSHHPVAVIGGVRLYDKIPGKFKVVGSDLCRFISTQLSGKRSFQKR